MGKDKSSDVNLLLGQSLLPPFLLQDEPCTGAPSARGCVEAVKNEAQ